MPIVFALVGATGVGKSRLSLELAERFDAEIIGVDSRQIYKGFAIGTAQPSREDMACVKHHQVDFLDPRMAYSAGDFCASVNKLLSENPDRNYILVGGTGLYLQSLMLGLPQIPKIDESVRKSFEENAAKFGNVSLYEEAKKTDPEAMEKVEVNNIQRIIRILEVFQLTGRKLSDWQKERVGGIGMVPVFWLNRSRENLYARIDARVDQMMADGWLDEIKNLAKTVPLDAPAWQSLGYRELLCAKDGTQVQNVLEEVKRKTRNYAKRQLTWFRWQVKSTEVDLDACSDPLEFIQKRLVVA
ncbi:MAG: tRNA (adenosine(37)-N6)-dimethylallyltransferase MiaA [Fibrobacter sp.]|nr:tRNA (adenosine(37)-N6)-dimethylallyltransferase MiaA [Fibrobacter sp.]